MKDNEDKGGESKWERVEGKNRSVQKDVEKERKFEYEKESEEREKNKQQ